MDTRSERSAWREARLRSLVTLVAAALSVVVAFSVPGTYLLVRYQEAAHHAEDTANDSALLVSRFIYGQETLWRFEAQRLESIISTIDLASRAHQQAVYDAAGTLIAAAGIPQPPPTVTRSATVTDGFRPVGRVTVESSFRPVIQTTVWIALVSWSIGALLFVLVRELPLRRLRSALQHSEAKYEALVESSIAGIVVIRDEALLFANPAAARIFGYASAAELLAHSELANYFNADDIAALQRESNSRPKELLSPETQELRGRHREGRLLRIEAMCRGVEWAGQPALLATLIDVTERKALEEQYAQAHKMEAIGALAGGMAHDFNNLLAIITSCAEFLLDAVTDERLIADVKQIQAAADRGASLTRQLLAFSRRQVLKLETADLNVIVAGARKMLERVIGEDIALSVAASPEPTLIRADIGQIEQIILNLAINARDAMPKGGQLTIETGTAQVEKPFDNVYGGIAPGAYAILSVVDSGEGMTAEVRSRIFEPFFTTKPQGKGTGLGLAMVYRIVKQMRGGITVVSAVGEGTGFKIYFPLAGGAEKPAAQAAPIANPQEGNEGILVVEDSDPLREMVQRMLESAGFRVAGARSGPEALALIHSPPFTFDLLLTDVVLPELSGPEVAAALTRRHPGTRVLYMSGYNESAIAGHGVLRPGVALLQKPFTRQVMLETVRKILDAPLHEVAAVS